MQRKLPRIGIILSIFCLAASSAFASTRIDSLTTALNSSRSTIQKLDILEGLAEEYAEKDFHKLLEYGEQGYQLAKAKNYPDHLFRIGYLVIKANLESNQHERCITYFKDFEKLYQAKKIKVDDYSRIVYLECHFYNGVEDYSQLAKSVEKMQQLEEEVSPNSKNKIKGYTYQFRSNLAAHTKNFEDAENFLLKKAELNRLEDDNQGLTVSYFNLAVFHLESTKEYSKSVEYIKQGLEVAREISWDYIIAAFHNVHLDALVRQKNFFAAIDIVDTVERRANTPGRNVFNARMYQNIGDYYFETNAYDIALDRYRKSLDQMGSRLNDRYSKDLCEKLANTFEAIGQFDSAYFYIKQASLVADSTAEAEKIESLKYYETKMDLVEEERENDQLNATLLIRNISLAFGLIILGFLAYISWAKIRNNIKLKGLNLKIASDAEKLAKAKEHLEFFSRSIYHDITSRINLILSFSELKKNSQVQIPEEEQVDEFTMLIYKNALHLKQFVQDIRTFSRLELNGTPTVDVDLNRVVSLILEMFGGQIYEKKAILNIEELPVIVGHETPIIQLFQNMIENAIKYTKEGAAPYITISCIEAGDFYQIEVENNGHFIPADMAEQIFDPFYRIKRKKTEGSGLGLAICKRIVNYYRGDIWLKKSNETGNIFAFTLPKYY